MVMIQARYVDEQPLREFLTALFDTQYTMVHTRGYFQCMLPRGLKTREQRILNETVKIENYTEP
ncbi:hypothetical protein PspLS_04353 [Pyricularia sp. CBS 133598]|nr:hypothetical protein PspLS_04353 [Pyricularia sp. CBS 133598]